jgi:hypothetical protein|tara:strand:+ start:117 stop:278 length:162 start_codon:yes stop_codon:yes gene_type:complete
MKPEIQRVRDLPRRDIAVYEHTETQERRKLTGKAVATWGLKEAWRRAADTPTG